MSTKNKFFLTFEILSKILNIKAPLIDHSTEYMTLYTNTSGRLNLPNLCKITMDFIKIKIFENAFSIKIAKT